MVIENHDNVGQAEIALSGPVQFRARLKQDSSSSLLSLAEQFESGRLLRPPHQRSKDAWNRNRRRSWMDRCRAAAEGSANDPLGIICIYSLTEEGCRQEYLNEGLQRISAAVDARAWPQGYGFSSTDEVNAVLSATFIHIQNRQYETHRHAVDDFVAVNNGVSLEPGERHHHILVYSPHWATLWSYQVELWRDKTHHALASYCRTVERRNAVLSRYRADLQLFSVAHTKKPTKYGSDSALEEAVRSCFTKSNPDLVKKLISKMETHAAEVEHVWRELFPEPGRMMHESLARWCLGVMFVHDLMEIPRWKDFFHKLFDSTGGSSTFAYKDPGERQKSVLLGTKLDCFGTVAKTLGCQIKEKQKRERHELTGLVKPGWHADHVRPFADHGEGEMQLLPARLNAAKNARRLTD